MKSLKICILGKYPPIEGGVSCGTYWTVRALAQRGHRIFIVTNTLEAGFEYQAQIVHREKKLLEPENTTLINTHGFNCRFIPAYPAFVSKLAGLAIDCIRKEKIDVLYSNYLLPYGVAAYLVKSATNVPWFLDHAGSDITNLFSEEQLSPVFQEVFKKADVVVNSAGARMRLKPAGFIDKNKLAPRPVDKMFARILDNDFSPHVKPVDLAEYFLDFQKERPVFTYVGKVSELRKTFAFIKALALLSGKQFYLLFITEMGKSRELLKNVLAKYGLTDRTCILPFQPPWKIPAFFNASTCVVCPEDEEEPYFPKGTHGSRIPLEAMMCGRCVVVGKGMSEKLFYASCQDGKHLLAVNPHNVREFSRKLKLILDEPAYAQEIGRQARLYIIKHRAFFEKAVDSFIENLRYTAGKK
jgi:glycosyltransferase involved in cell wall biosynthesis